MVKDHGAPPLPPGTEAMFSVTCKDVVMGRGSGTQNHCGNVTYRKLVFLNKELYATSSKFDKLKISKAIVAAVREFGGKFMQADEKRGGLYYDIGDKRAWDKTSQALREGQAEVRARLADEDPSGMSKVAEYKQVISEQTFFAYACKMLESLYHPATGDSGISACGQLCPHAKRRQTLNKIGVDAMAIHQAMQSLAPPQVEQIFVQASRSYDVGSASGGVSSNSVTPTLSAQGPLTSPASMQSTLQPYQGNLDSIQPLPSLEPLPYNQGLFSNGTATYTTEAPALGGTTGPVESIDSFEPLPFNAPGPLNIMDAPVGPNNACYSYSHTLDPHEASSTENGQHIGSIEPLPYQNQEDSYRPPPIHDRSSNETFGSVFSLRKFCSEELHVTSDEGKALMAQLNLEVDDLIRRKSYGLIQIDTTQAFEDLVFEDDSMNFKDPTPYEDIPNPPRPSPKKNRESSSSSSAGRTSGGSGKLLNFKDDMSLMNMSILTLEERAGSESSGLMGESPKDEIAGTKRSSIMKPHRSSDGKGSRRGRVSFGGKNISLMSMDDRSFSQLVDSISDFAPNPEQGGDQQESDAPERQHSDLSVESISRRVGFPLRKTIARKYGDLPSEVDSFYTESNAQISTLTISECDDVGASSRRSDFTKLAGEVESPGTSKHSLRPTDMSISNMAALAESNMSLGSDLDHDLLS